MLSEIDKVKLKTALTLSVTIPDEPTEDFLLLVGYALEQDLKKTPEGLSNLPAELQDEYKALHNYLHPYYINMLNLTETPGSPATIGEVQTYFLEVLTLGKIASPLEDSIAQCPVGELPKHEALTLLSRNANQVPLLEYLIEAYYEFMKKPFDKEYVYWSELFSIEEWTLIKNQCSDPIILSDEPSNLLDNLITILKNSEQNLDDNKIAEFKTSVVKHSTRKIAGINENLQSEFRFDDACEYRSSTREQILVNLSLHIQDKPHFKVFLGSILSTLPKSDWNSFLEEIGFVRFGEGEFTLNYSEAGRLFKNAPVIIWKELAELPGLKEAMRKGMGSHGIIPLKNVSLLLNNVFYRHRFELEALFELSNWVNSRDESLSSVIGYINSFPVDRWASLFRSKRIEILLNQVNKPEYLQYCQLFRQFSISLRHEEVLRFMNSWFFRKHGILENQFLVRPVFLSLASPFLTDWLAMAENMRDFCYEVKTFHNLAHLLVHFSHRPEIKQQLLENEVIQVNLGKDEPDALTLSVLILELNDEFSAYIKKLGNKNIDERLLSLAHTTALKLADAKSNGTTESEAKAIASIFSENPSNVFIKYAGSLFTLQFYLRVYAALESPDLERFLALLPKSKILEEYFVHMVGPDLKKLGPDHLYKLMVSEGMKNYFVLTLRNFSSIIFEGLKNKLHDFLDNFHTNSNARNKPETQFLIELLSSYFRSLEQAEDQKFFIEELFNTKFLDRNFENNMHEFNFNTVSFGLLLEKYNPGNLVTLIATHPTAINVYKRWIQLGLEFNDLSRFELIKPHVATADPKHLEIIFAVTDAALKENKRRINQPGLILANIYHIAQGRAETIVDDWKEYLPASFVSKASSTLN